MTDQVEAVAVEATEAANPAFKTNAVPSAIPAAEPEKPAEKPVAKVEPEEEAPEEPDTEDSAASDGADPPAHPKNKGVGKRINELTREKHDALREAQYWKEQALKATKAEPAQEAPAQASKPEIKGKPKLQDFDFDPEAHAEALVEWTLNQREQAKAAESRVQTLQQKEQAFAEEHPDYFEVTRAPHVPFTQAVISLMAEADKPADVAYHLAKNLDELAAIAAMTPIAAARAIGRIEAKLEAPPAPAVPREPPKKTTNAPPPPKTVSGAGKPEVSVDDPQITPAQRIALWRAQRTKR